MKHVALDIIQEEHLALSAMLRSLNLLLAQARRDRRLPDFAVLRAMLFYVDEFPQKRHHRQESELLFPKLLQRVPELAAVVQELERQHAQGEAAVRELEHALLAFEVMGESRREAFEQAAQRYTRDYLEHMATEERELLPVARRSLGASDWAELDAAFAANQDPLTGHAPAAEFEPLFRQILMQAPAPIGLGPAR